MRLTLPVSLTRSQWFVIFAVTFGGILEWYEIYLYIFWAPAISKLFFDNVSESVNLLNTISLFTIGFFFRPLGGMVFGRLGDRLGRKRAFILSILVMTIPTFLIGVLPVYQQIGILSPIFLAILRILQTFPAGGEYPGAFCYLYENANAKNRKFMTSFGAAGNQIGIALSALECILLKIFLPEEIYMEWGWRISFIVGGFIGLMGLYLRYKLHETHLFQELVIHHGIVKKSIWDVIVVNWKKITHGFLFSFIDTVAFYILSIIFPIYFNTVLGTTDSENHWMIIFLMALTTIPLPFFGYLGDLFSVKKLMIGSTIGILLILYPLFITLNNPSPVLTGVIGLIFLLCLTCITALLPFLMCSLFSTSVRYTCMGLSFNLADGILGGISPVLAVLLLQYVGLPGSVFWMLLTAAFVSLFSFMKIIEKECR